MLVWCGYKVPLTQGEGESVVKGLLPRARFKKSSRLMSGVNLTLRAVGCGGLQCFLDTDITNQWRSKTFRHESSALIWDLK